MAAARQDYGTVFPGPIFRRWWDPRHRRYDLIERGDSGSFARFTLAMTAAAPITINADEVNCLIYAYLKDSGNSFIILSFNLANLHSQVFNTLLSVYSTRVASTVPFT